MMHGILLMMPRLSVKFNKVCFGTFLSYCRDIFLTLTPNCDLDLEIGNIIIMCDIQSNFSGSNTFGTMKINSRQG